MKVTDHTHAPEGFASKETVQGIYLTEGWTGPVACLKVKTKRKIPATAGNRTPAVQPIASTANYVYRKSRD
jgi:hypothetical protein